MPLCLSSLRRYDTDAMRSDMRRFFTVLNQVERLLDTRTGMCGLNRLQRMRCRANLARLRRIKEEFFALTYEEDIRTMYAMMQRYVRLDAHTLLEYLGKTEIKRTTLFVPV